MSKEKFIPRYQQIYLDLRQRIEDGTYPPGHQLPFERELCEQYAVQRITVRKSLELLAGDGLIEKQAGRGSFVKAAPEAMDAKASKAILFLMRKSQNDIQSNASAFNAQLFFPMERICSGRGFTLVYAGLDEADDCAALIRRHNAAGAFLVSTLPEGVYATVERMGIAALCINHCSNLFLSVLPDNAGGVRSAVEFLLHMGHARIGFIGGMVGATNAAERFDSYSLSLYRHGLTPNPAYLLNGAWTFDGGFAAMDALLDTLAPDEYPTAVLAASDMMAIGAMDAIKKHGLSVPEGISVIGFDDIDLCKFCAPQLTSVRTDPDAMAHVAFEHLQRLIAQGMREHDRYAVRLPAKLIKRQSVQAPPP